jgi:hypothetical protein
MEQEGTVHPRQEKLVDPTLYNKTGQLFSRFSFSLENKPDSSHLLSPSFNLQLWNLSR